LIDQHCYQALVSACLLGQESGFVQWSKLFRGRLANETSSRDRDEIRDADWRDLDSRTISSVGTKRLSRPGLAISVAE
jgi:hypothetical protein